jgi:ArsR family transcriptional regulator
VGARPGARLSDEAFLRIAKALADPSRLAILERVAAERDVLCADIAGAFPIAQATMSHHLKELREAGLIATEKVGKCIRLTVRPETIAAYRRELARRIPGS